MFFAICFFLYISATSILGSSITKVLISGLGGQHDYDVARSFQLGYESYNGEQYQGIISYYIDNYADNSFTYANSNGYKVIIRSTTGLNAAESVAKNYQNIQLFMPAGSNAFIYVNGLDINSSPVIITGAGSANNQTGYKVEFFSIDPINSNQYFSSFSNGYIAGQLVFLADYLNITVQEARLLARNELSRRQSFSLYNGYGKINVGDIISKFSLPVELISFTSMVMKNNILLKWKTAQEVNNNNFTIERKVGTESEWIAIGKVNGNGNSNSIKEYNYTDKNLNGGQYNYRLKQIDNNGYYEYSNVITAVITENYDELKLYQNYPNPFNSTTNVAFEVSDKANVKLLLYDILGREVKCIIDKRLEEGYYLEKVSFEQLPSGNYIISLQNSKIKRNIKISYIK